MTIQEQPATDHATTPHATTDAYSSFIDTKARRIDPAGHEPGPLHPIMFDFQRDIVAWAVRMGRAAIFADCGLGKTLMQIEWAREVHAATGRPVLILAPPAVANQTAREGTKVNVTVARCMDASDVIDGINVTNYERLHLFDADEFGGIVLDESSILKSYTGATRNAIIEAFAATRYRLACTATPAPNDHTELGNHSEFLGIMTRPEMLSMFFVHDGGSTQNWRIKGHARTEFWEWVCSWSAVLRSPADLGYDASGFDLPELNIETHVVMKGEPAGGMLFADAATLSLNERRAARKSSLSERVTHVAEMVNESSDPWIVWCNLNAEGDALTQAIDGAVQVTGSMSPDDKATMLEAFTDGAHRVMITKPSIAGFGLNWQHVHHMAFCGISDSYEQFYQAVRRCWRFGQTSAVDAHIVISEAETVIARNVRDKEKRADEMAHEVAKSTSAAVLSNIRGKAMTKNEYETDTKTGDGWTMHLGDCVDVTRTLADDSIDYSVFSPPFASLYTYSANDRDMGNCANHAEFYDHFAFLVGELFRVIKPGHNVSFHCMNLPTSKVRDGYIGISDFRGDLIRLFQSHGWIYHSEVCIWKDPVVAMQRTKALGLLHKQLKKDACMSRQGIPDYVVTMRKPGVNPNPVTNTNATFPVHEWQKYASPIWDDIRPGDTLQKTSAREDADERHICPLQLEVIRRCLRLWTNEGDTVLSPFAGIGSEGFEAIKASREFVGIELKRSYYDQACRNMIAGVSERSQASLF